MNLPPDNPVWQALNSLQQHFNCGTQTVKYFPENVSPFVGMEDWNAADISTLEGLLPSGRNFSVMMAQKVDLPASFEILFTCPLYQMVCLTPAAAIQNDESIRPLGAKHIPQMLELTGKTKPGPFYAQTYTMGHYYGIFQHEIPTNGRTPSAHEYWGYHMTKLNSRQGRRTKKYTYEKLVSMAGERLQLPGYTEVSAICTDPEYLGNGYALLLTSFLAHKIQHAGNIPFLHVKTDNSRAIDVYKRAGFEIRKEVFFAVFRKK